MCSNNWSFAEEALNQIDRDASATLGPVSQFVRDLSTNVPILYGMFSIVLALGLGIGAAIVRRQLSNIRKKCQKIIFCHNMLLYEEREKYFFWRMIFNPF